MIIVDATVLIALAKLARLNLLRELYGHVAVGPRVKKEVIDGGRAIGAAEVSSIEAAFEAKWMRDLKPTPAETRLAVRIFKGSRLHHGEAEAIALAHFRKLPVLLDDKEARIVAETMNVQYLGTAGVLLEAFFREVVDYAGLEDALNELSRVIWLSAEVMAEVLRRAREETT